MNLIKNLKEIDKFRGFIFFDLEFTCWEDSNVFNNWKESKKPPEVIQMGFAHCEKYNGEINSQFSTYLKPIINSNISNYCKNLLKIDQDIINIAPVIEIAVQNLSNWLNKFQDDTLFLSWGSEDFYLLNEDCIRKGVSNPLDNIFYLDLMRVSYQELGENNILFFFFVVVKKHLNIYEEDHSHHALEDAIELQSILQGLKKL